MIPCKNHPEAPAPWSCSFCDAFYCDECIQFSKPSRTVFELCKGCGRLCSAVEQPREPLAMGSLLGAFSYPFDGAGPAILGACVLFMAGVSYVPLVGGVLATAVFFGLGMNVLQSTMRGEREAPEWGDYTDLMELLKPMLLAILVPVIAFAPALLVRNLSQSQELYLAACLLGLVYVPGAGMAVALGGNPLAVLPTTVLPLAWKLGHLYAIAVGLTLAMCALGLLSMFFVPRIAPSLFAPLLDSAICLYLWTVTMRAFGLLCYERRAELGLD